MGIDVWVRRDAAQPGPDASVPLVEVPQAIPLEGRPDVSELDWSELRQKVAGCQLCELQRSRTQTVFGVGNPQADWSASLQHADTVAVYMGAMESPKVQQALLSQGHAPATPIISRNC